MSHHLLYFHESRNAINEILHGVNLFKFRLEVGWHAVAKLFHGVNTSGFEQFAELWSHSVDTHQIGMVSPLEDEFAANSSSFFQSFTSCRFRTFFEQCVGIFYACGNEFGCINFAYTFDVDNFVSHKIKY